MTFAHPTANSLPLPSPLPILLHYPPHSLFHLLLFLSISPALLYLPSTFRPFSGRCRSHSLRSSRRRRSSQDKTVPGTSRRETIARAIYPDYDDCREATSAHCKLATAASAASAACYFSPNILLHLAAAALTASATAVICLPRRPTPSIPVWHCVVSHTPTQITQRTALSPAC